MKMNPLGRTGMQVSELCLGTMTFGTQTSETEAHAQIDYALAAGVNFIDTAEMYPVNPIRAETTGRSEEILGTWHKKTGRRGDYILTTKHSGEGMAAVRNGAPISSETIAETVEGSLKRLQTDYIDLYQFHWPNRGSYMFRKNWDYDPTTQNREETLDNMRDCLEALQGQVDKGNIRAFGLSNESAWGTAQWLRLSEEGVGPRVASIQNEYSLLCRMYDTDLAELSVNEDVGLLAFSPLGTGLLTGKYQGGVVPEGSRKSIVPELGGRHSLRVYDAVAAYLEIAARHGLDPVHMALAWCRTRPFMASAIFGATKQAQLEQALKSVELELSAEVLEEISRAHRAHPMPY
ncbi:oxidoreductase, aldo/keto reductase family protein [Roseobacter sp. MED193]|uniref:aldo/keto reductase n=1 Tax=Roseobacter sp. MED193 TaxID=314262 RepID=UPI000068B696|nr:aldo/keto reductase [Roseobacter sp. MED193]EAQ47454.1 oxidoreductase, aldo/keto reductase family protein [Roseobacter sp. MED193]